MIIKKLNITDVRGYSEAEFIFEPGMNLVVGINGVGKTTVLDALRICLSHIQPVISASRSRKDNFILSDIKIGSNTLQVSCDFEVEKQNFNLLIVRQREAIRIVDTENIRKQVEETPNQENITPAIKEVFPDAGKAKSQPVGIFFSTRRSLMLDRDAGKSLTMGGQAAAFADALSSNREFNLRIFAEWIRVQQSLGVEDPKALKNVEVLKKAVYRFLPGFSDLKVSEIDGVSTFTIVKDKTIFNIAQLSDGERGVLALVLDIARRLSQANPGLDDPLTDGEAVILIDELDLHLHPKWQRSIVENLTNIFPNCQFIATTHSPQIISSLNVENIFIIHNNEVIKPEKSFGMDTNWILNFLMDGGDRPQNATDAIKKIEELISEVEFDKARDEIEKYKQEGMDLSEWTIFESRMSNLEIFGDE